MIVFQNNHGMTNPGFGLGLAWSQEDFGFASCSWNWNILSRYDTLFFCAFLFSLSFQTTSIGAYSSHAEWPTFFPFFFCSTEIFWNKYEQTMNRHTDIEYPTPTNQPTVELGSANKPMVAVKSALRLYGSKVTLGKWLGGQDPEEPVDRKVVGRSCSFEVTWPLWNGSTNTDTKVLTSYCSMQKIELFKLCKLTVVELRGVSQGGPPTIIIQLYINGV